MQFSSTVFKCVNALTNQKAQLNELRSLDIPNDIIKIELFLCMVDLNGSIGKYIFDAVFVIFFFCICLSCIFWMFFISFRFIIYRELRARNIRLFK